MTRPFRSLRTFAIVAPALLVAGCGESSEVTDDATTVTLPSDSITQYATNGAQIFYTGNSSSGDPIRVKAPSADPNGRATMACVDCHGPEGRGVDVRTESGTLRTPDISFAVLNSPMSYRSGLAYDEATLALTLRTGIRIDGYKLSPHMPRWKMSSSDMANLIDHLKRLRQTTGGTPR